jgi:hypothetical protein
MARLARAPNFIKSLHDPVAATLRQAAESGADRDIKRARTISLKRKPAEPSGAGRHCRLLPKQIRCARFWDITPMPSSPLYGNDPVSVRLAGRVAGWRTSSFRWDLGASVVRIETMR